MQRAVACYREGKATKVWDYCFLKKKKTMEKLIKIISQFLFGNQQNIFRY